MNISTLEVELYPSLSSSFGPLQFENSSSLLVVGRNCDTPVQGDLVLLSELMAADLWTNQSSVFQ